MSVRTLLIACVVTAGIVMSGAVAAQSYLQSGDLNSIRQSNPAAPGVSLQPSAPRRDNASAIGARFSQGMAQAERQAQRQREASATSDMQMKNLTDPQRAPQGRYPGTTVNAQGAVYFDEQGPTACTRDPVSGQVQCGASTSR